jgi:hypothetical protein
MSKLLLLEWNSIPMIQTGRKGNWSLEETEANLAFKQTKVRVRK